MPYYRVGILKSLPLGLGISCIVQNVSWHFEAEFEPKCNQHGDVLSTRQHNRRADVEASVVIPRTGKVPAPGWELSIRGVSIGGIVSLNNTVGTGSPFTVRAVDIVGSNSNGVEARISAFHYYDTPPQDTTGWVLTDEQETYDYRTNVLDILGTKNARIITTILSRTVSTRTYRCMVPAGAGLPGSSSMPGSSTGPAPNGSIVNRWMRIDRGTSRAYYQHENKECWETWQMTGEWSILSKEEQLALKSS